MGRGWRGRTGWLLAGAAALVLAVPAASAADFTRPGQVANAMERHYNSGAYKAKLWRQSGARPTRRVLCAYDGSRAVQCSGGLVLKGRTVRVEWELVKSSRTRARLSWTVTGRGVFDYQRDIVAPSAFGLRAF